MAAPRLRSRPDLRTRFAVHLPQLLGPMLEQLTAEVDYYQHLDPDALARAAEGTHRNLALFIRLLQEDRPPRSDEIELIMRAAASRAEDRMPLSDVLTAYLLGVRTCWGSLRDLAGPSDVRQLIEIGDLMLHYVQVITSAATETYLETTAALSGRDREARAALRALVLAGQDEPGGWEELGLEPWTVRSVLALHLPPLRFRDETRLAVESRRRIRAVQEAFATQTGAPTLDMLTQTGGVLVARGSVTRAEAQACLGRVLKGRWYAGVATACTPGDTPDALLAAQGCAEVAERLGRAPGVHELADLLFEVQVTRPGPARAALHQLMSPLYESPELLDTLSAYVEESGRRADTAARLHVHPNTLDYRLRRIRTLTGLDPSDRDQGQLVKAALVVRKFLAADPDL